MAKTVVGGKVGYRIFGESMLDLMKELHEEIKFKIEDLNAKYKKYGNQKRCNQLYLSKLTSYGTQ